MDKIKMKTAIFLNEVRFHACHGVMPQERVVGADFTVSIRVEYDFMRAVETDDLADTISYADLYDLVAKEMRQPSRLLEHVAGRIVRAVVEAYPQVTAVDIRLSKDNPPMGADCQGAGVELHYINK